MPLRIVSLNCWGGRALHPLMRFFERQAATTDIFCLQEVFDTEQAILDDAHEGEYLCASLFPKIAAVLPDFDGTFARFDDRPARMSLAMFVRRGLPVKSIEDFNVYVPDQPIETGRAVRSARKLMYATVALNGRDLTVANYHGIWTIEGKNDSPERLEQSRRLKEFLAAKPTPHFLCGDFNLLPETESIRILEEGMINLVRANGVQSTRTPLYRDYDRPGASLFADYAFVTPDLKATKYEVLPYLASDHAAQRVELE